MGIVTDVPTSVVFVCEVLKWLDCISCSVLHIDVDSVRIAARVVSHSVCGNPAYEAYSGPSSV